MTVLYYTMARSHKHLGGFPEPKNPKVSTIDGLREQSRDNTGISASSCSSTFSLFDKDRTMDALKLNPVVGRPFSFDALNNDTSEASGGPSRRCASSPYAHFDDLLICHQDFLDQLHGDPRDITCQPLAQAGDISAPAGAAKCDSREAA